MVSPLLRCPGCKDPKTPHCYIIHTFPVLCVFFILFINLSISEDMLQKDLKLKHSFEYFVAADDSAL
jgi:hypothetical protein